MIKNKKILYALIPVNLIIWGYFCFSIIGFNKGDTIIQAKDLSGIRKNNAKSESLYEFSLNYPDPFLKDQAKRRSVSLHGGNNSSSELKKKPAPPVQLPLRIQYLGLVKNGQNGKKAALVLLNGESRIITPNQTIEGITFRTLERDSLVARRGKEQIIARKEK